MNRQSFVQYFDLALGLLLLVRLFNTQLYKKYQFFCGFLIADLFGSITYILYEPLRVVTLLAYERVWLATKPLVWLFTLLTIYFLLERILIHLPGLLRLSKRVLYVVISFALIIGLFSAFYEYSAPGFLHFKQMGSFISYCWVIEMIFDRVIASAALISLLGIVIFLFWFPVTIPRNLAMLSVGFTIYLAATTIFLLFRSSLPDEVIERAYQLLNTLSILLGVVSIACRIFWLLCLSNKGESTPSQLAPQRSALEQDRLISQLELINKTLNQTTR